MVGVELWTLGLNYPATITSHLNGFFPSWNFETMPFKVGLSCECSFAIFTLKWLFFFMNWVNVFLQSTSINKSRTTHNEMWHLDGFFPSWDLATCLFKPTFCVNAVLQISHFFMNCIKVLLHLFVSFQINFLILWYLQLSKLQWSRGQNIVQKIRFCLKIYHGFQFTGHRSPLLCKK